jgi:hypothetical protein
MRYIKTYEVRDKVWVKKDLEVNEMYGVAYFVHSMRGIDVVTIKEVEFDDGFPNYRVEEVGGVWYTNEMLGKVLSKEEIEARKCPFKVGDVVRVINTSDNQVSHLFNNRGVVLAIALEGSDNSVLVDFGPCYDCFHTGGSTSYGLKQRSAYWVGVGDIEVVNKQSLNECDL